MAEPRRRPLVIGQAPSRATDGLGAFHGLSGRKLAQLAGYPDRAALAGVVTLRNLLPRWPGPGNGQGDAFPRAAARAAAGRMHTCGRVVVLVGRAVAGVFGVAAEFFAAAPLRCLACGGRAVAAYVVPHPSGISHWWNEPHKRGLAGAHLRRILVADAWRRST